MKTIAALTLILALLFCVSVLAYNRAEYKKTSKPFFARAIGEDRDPNGGPAHAYATCEVDFDYLTESWWNELRGTNDIYYYSYASVDATGYRGSYAISAAAPNAYKAPTDGWLLFVWRAVYVDHRDKFREKDANGDLKVKLVKEVNGKKVIADRGNAQDYLYLTGAYASIDGERSWGNPRTYSAEAHARDFSQSEAQTWVCRDDSGSDTHGAGETCEVCE